MVLLYSYANLEYKGKLFMNILHDINPNRITTEKFVAVIEISKGSRNKYELDKETGLLKLDRVLFTSTHYPANYGFVPRTLSEDGDPLDVFVYCTQSILPMSLVECRPIGAIDMVDNNQIDTKLIAVPVGDPTYSSYKEITDLPPHLIDELMHFLRVYKDLEHKKTEISQFYNCNYAKKSIETCMKRYNDTKKDSK
jgi:inorganic pyrophosphatase